MRALTLALVATICISLSSCFKDEPANAECDIEAAWVHTDSPLDMFFYEADTLVRVVSTDNIITFNVKAGTDLSHQSPLFQLTPGATITPANGSEQDFSQGAVTYTVTSEDGQWQRQYYVFFNIVTRTVADTIRYHFNDNFSLGRSNCYVWDTPWDTGNLGYLLAGLSYVPGSVPGSVQVDPTKFPTLPYEQGYDGYGVQLSTMSTGSWGILNGKRIAAGNIFIGTFIPDSAITNTLLCTNFGQPFDRTPLKVRGYYKYKAGEQFQDEKGVICPDIVDQPDVYAVFYRNHDENGNPIVLNGHNVKSSPYIVALAQATGLEQTDEWTYFEMEFDYLEDLNQDLVNNRGYSITIVCSSSVDGAYFKGAVGSILHIDELELICTEIQ